MNRRFRTRGVTLVELAIVLAVIGLLMSVFLRSQGDAARWQWKDAEKEMTGLREAVVLYAAKNKTARRLVTVVDEGGMTVSVDDVLPAGRPILPCPDVNGDGVEDRQKEGELPPAGAVIVISLSATRGEVSNPLLDYGNCVLQKGALPWRSLPGVSRATDPWGNLYTYRVDSNFSNRLIGFDEHTRADIYDARFPFTLSADGFVEFRGGLPPPLPGDDDPDDHYKRPDDPAVMHMRVWSQYRESATFVPVPVPAIMVNERPSIVCQRPPCPPRVGEDNPVVGGIIAETEMTLITHQPFGAGFPPARVRRIFEGPRNPPGQLSPYDIVEGLPFVIVAHGRDDRGARLPPDKAPAGGNAPVRGVFMAGPFDLTRASDINNALDFGVSQIPAGDRVQFNSLLQGGNFGLADAALETGQRAWGARFRTPRMDNGFVQPRGVLIVDHLMDIDAPNAPDIIQPVHDDVVRWMTSDELSRAAYRAKILPAPPLPPFGIPD